MPKALRNTLAERIAQDFISSSFPYGAPVAGELSHAAGSITARPKVVFVADDKMLGTYSNFFANSICTLEERDPYFDSTINTLTILKNLTDDNHYKNSAACSFKRTGC